MHLLANQFLAQEFTSLKHPRDFVQWPESLDAWRQFTFLIRVTVVLARRPNAGQEHFLDLTGGRLDVDRIAVEHFDDGAGKVLLLAGVDFGVGLIVLPQANTIVLGDALGDAELGNAFRLQILSN